MEKEQIKQIRSIIEELQASPKEYNMYLIPRELKLESQEDFDETDTFQYKGYTYFRLQVKATTPNGIFVGYEFSSHEYIFIAWGYASDFKLVLSNVDTYEELFMSIDLETMEQTKLDIRINEYIN